MNNNDSSFKNGILIGFIGALIFVYTNKRSYKRGFKKGCEATYDFCDFCDEIGNN